ncbi:MAG: hypothetical protein QMD44_12950 [Thermodesulfovibrionales bacterium]|nr:hypothetical protein [Thermodesulfovibrionales bacterium]
MDEELLDEDFGYLPSYAQNIYDEVKRAGSKAVRAREDELIRLAGIPEPRIIKAREVLKKHLDKLEDNNLIQYEKEGDIYILKGSENRAF